MIRSLRRKFILINLLLVGLVLAVVFGVLVGSNAQRLGEQSRVSLRMALEWADGGSPPRFEIASPPDGWEPDRSGRENKAQHFSMVPVFVVTVEDGRVTAINDGGQVAVSDEVASQAVQEVLSSGSGQGVLHGLSLRFQVEHGSGGASRIAFADCSWESASLRNLVLTCLLVWALAMVGFFFISLFLASLAVRPVEKAWKQQRQFVADASHELKTPLAAIRLLADSIEQNEGMDEATMREFVSDIGTEADRLQRTTEKLLDLSRRDDGASSPRVPVDLAEVARSTLRLLSPLAAKLGVSLRCEPEAGCIISAPEDDAYQIIFNLAENAVKYNVEGGSVDISVRREGGRVLLIVEDRGIGIPEADLPNIFSRFYRVDKARSREKGGSGLGLSIVHDAVSALGGSIEVEAREGGGTRFTVSFPEPGEGEGA